MVERRIQFLSYKTWSDDGWWISKILDYFDLPDIARKERREPKQRTRADIKVNPLLLYFEQTDANTSRSVRYLRGSSLLGGAFSCAGLGAGCA